MSSNLRVAAIRLALPPAPTHCPAPSPRMPAAEEPLQPPRTRLLGAAAAVLVLAALALCYGAFAAAALYSAHRGGGALQASDFYLAGANPWAPPSGGWPPLEPRLALGVRPAPIP